MSAPAVPCGYPVGWMHPARDAEEWDRAWFALGAHAVNAAIPAADRTVAADPDTGESWQYMGTDGGTHCFRHRRHPTTGDRAIVFIADARMGAA